MKRFLIMTLFGVIGIVSTGFQLDNAIVPQQDILSGGPPKDGIPALLEPKFIESENATFMNADDQVIGVIQAGEAKAYPLKILTWHEVVNDTLGGTPLMVTY